MKQKYSFFNIVLVLGLLFTSSNIFAQNYFKASVESNKYNNQKIHRFSNQDVLIVDSSLEPLEIGEERGEIAMRRLDECGNEVWAQSYSYDEGYLEIADFKISENDEVFVFGSFYKGLEERIFLSKFNGTTGVNNKFVILNTGTVDHFSYSLDIKDGQLLVYGLLFDFNTLKLGFVVIFNENLSYLWGKQFTPFESTGKAIISSDNGFMGWSGAFLIKLNSIGELEWAKEIDANPEVFLVQGPFEVADGYIFESNRNDQSFFFKLSATGTLLWKSDQFKASGHGAALSMLADGNIICTYNYPRNNTSELCQLLLSPDGKLSEQRSMIFENTFNTGTLYQTLDENNNLTIAANANPISIGAVDVKDFIFQYSLDLIEEVCWTWETFDEVFLNDINLSLSSSSLDMEMIDMELETSTTLEVVEAPSPIEELCGETIGPELIFIDTLLPCGEDWEVFLPGINFEWIDNHPSSSRNISEPGTYLARKISCTNPQTIEYTLKKSNCGCQVYVPNVFSPNFDGFNDRLEFFSDCVLDKIEMKVYDRWGELIFQNNRIDDLWDGTFKGKDMPNGVYIVLIKYEFTDLDGSIQQVFLNQDVTIVR